MLACGTGQSGRVSKIFNARWWDCQNFIAVYSEVGGRCNAEAENRNKCEKFGWSADTANTRSGCVVVCGRDVRTIAKGMENKTRINWNTWRIERGRRKSERLRREIWVGRRRGSRDGEGK